MRYAGLMIVIAAAAALGYSTLASSSSPMASPGSHAQDDLGAPGLPRSEPPLEIDRRNRPRSLGEDHGTLRDGTTLFDDDLPGVARLDPTLLAALRQAATDAAADGIEFVVNSGWRSAEYQQHLLDEAISNYGSKKEAARWVASAATSVHVSGDAVDIGPARAAAWLSEHGAEYGLCRVYDNEPWHFELRLEAIDRDCPPLYPDPTHDPRMRPSDRSFLTRLLP